MIIRHCNSHRPNMAVSGIVSLCLFLGTVGYEADGHEPAGSQGKPIDPAMQAIMDKWQAYATPNGNHKVLNPLVGTWSHVVKWWMKPGTEPEISKGSSETKWMIGDRFLQHIAKGISMGQPFEGMGMTGFDNKKRKYQTIWMDNMGTGMMIGEGTYDSSHKTLTDHGHFMDAVMGQRAYRGVITFIDEYHHSYEMYSLDHTGKEFRMMEIVYTRTN